VDLGRPFRKNDQGEMGKMMGEAKGEWSDTLELTSHFNNPSHHFIGDFLCLTLCIWVTFEPLYKHHIIDKI